MQARPAACRRVLRFGAFFLFCLNCVISVVAQDPVKFDEFGNLSTDDAQARLDNFAVRLNEIPDAKGFIIGSRSERNLQGAFLRLLHGYRNYLTDSRGVDPQRVAVVELNPRDKETIQLWTTEAGATAPLPSKESNKSDKPVQFDSLTVGDGCVGEYTIDLEEPDDALKFFAGALQTNPTSKGLLIIHPSFRAGPLTANTLAEKSRQTLITENKLADERVAIQITSRRSCAEMDLWLVPAAIAIPDPDAIAVFQAQLMAEAERQKYQVRRVMFVGNERTRDNTIRRRFLMNEGELFQRALLEQSLNHISKLKGLWPVVMHDVEVSLDRTDRTIDISLFLHAKH